MIEIFFGWVIIEMGGHINIIKSDQISVVRLDVGGNILGGIAAGIILFNPDLLRLKENIEAIYQQVELLVLIDNNSNNIEVIEREYGLYENIFFIKNKDNFGIAKALNQAMRFCQSKGYAWVLTLDQDSVCPSNLIQEYHKYVEIPKVAIISPIINDRNMRESSTVKHSADDFEEIKKCITSATLTNVKIWESIGGFDEMMFIDLVDFEYCKRILQNGFKILRVNTVILLHEVGRITQPKFLFWDLIILNHSPFRKYYISRNLIYVAKKHRTYGGIVMAYLRAIKLLLQTEVYEKDKIKKGMAILRGMKSGRKL